MSQVRDRLRQAIDEQRKLSPERRAGSDDAESEAAFRSVREAARELEDELAHVPGLRIEIDPDGIRIELYDKHLWFGYDTREQVFLGSEQDTEWMEGGLREASYKWETAAACIEAMIQACARYVSLAEAIGKLSSGR